MTTYNYIFAIIIPTIPKLEQLFLNLLTLACYIHLGVSKEIINLFSCHNSFSISYVT